MAIFRAENGHFPGWDLARKSETHPRQIPTWKMAIIQAWIFRIRGVK